MIGLSRHRMRNQLIITFFILILFAVFTTTFFLINRMHFLVREQTIRNHTRTVNQTILNINNTVADIDQYYHYILSNRLVLAGLQKEDFGKDPRTYEAVVYLKDLMFSLIMSNEELDASIYVSKKGIDITSTSGIILPDFFSSAVFPTLPVVQEIYRNPNMAIWYLHEEEDVKHVYYMRGIQNPSSGDVLGILSFAVKTKTFRDQIRSLGIPEGGLHFCNNNGKIIFSTNSAMEGELFPYFKRIQSGGYSQAFEADRKFYISRAASNSWIIISEVPAANLYGNVNAIIRWGMVIAFVCLIAGTFISVIISRMYTRDLTILVKVMEASTHGQLERISIPGSNIEFRSLANTYNTMIQNLQELTDNLKKEIREKTVAEQALLDLNETLEQKVAERTAQLKDSLKALRQAQNHLIEREKMASLGTLVSGIAHEINNPLNYITTGVAALGKVLNGSTQDPLVTELFENVRIGAERTAEIVGELRQYSRSDEESYTEFDIHDSIELALKLLYNEYKQDIIISKYFDDIPSFIGNSGKINQVMVNIIKNSIDALKTTDNSAKRITITTQKVQRYNSDFIEVDICDNGHPIPQEYLQKIFDPFFTTKEPGKGTGLGLSISLSIINSHSGEIEAENTLEGPKFSIFLPAPGTSNE